MRTYVSEASKYLSDVFIIKPTRCANFTNLFWHETRHVSDSSSAHNREFIHVHSAVVYFYKPVWHIPLLNVQWINSWWWTEELSEICRVSCQNKFVKLVHLVGFIIKKFVTIHGHTNVKKTFQIAYCFITVMNCLVMSYFSLIFRKYSSCEEGFPVKSVDIKKIFIFLPEFQFS